MAVANLPSRARWHPKGDVADRQTYGLFASHVCSRFWLMPRNAMTQSLLNRQSDLPGSIPLFRYVPVRVPHSWQNWNPALVRSAADLPQYLILGDLDSSTFQQSAAGWSARWQGTEAETHFDVAYQADWEHWEVRQTWCGLDGGISVYSTHMPLDRVIAQALYSKFPEDWDRAAKSQFASRHQITVVEQPEKASSVFGIPDGAFRTIVFPMSVRNLRYMRQWIQNLVGDSPLAYPVTVEAKLVFQALNYLEGKAPAWTAQEAVSFNQSVAESGLAPHGFPVREVADDGSASWTLRREMYFVFIVLPFAGLTDFLNRLVSPSGPIRPEFRFELRPVVLPAAFQLQGGSIAVWDEGRTTRSFLQLQPPRVGKDVLEAEDTIQVERTAASALAEVEAISADVVKAIGQLHEALRAREDRPVTD